MTECWSHISSSGGTAFSNVSITSLLGHLYTIYSVSHQTSIKSVGKKHIQSAKTDLHVFPVMAKLEWFPCFCHFYGHLCGRFFAPGNPNLILKNFLVMFSPQADLITIPLPTSCIMNVIKSCWNYFNAFTIDCSGYEIKKPLMSFQKRNPQMKSVLLMWQISHFGLKECKPTNLVDF